VDRRRQRNDSLDRQSIRRVCHWAFGEVRTPSFMTQVQTWSGGSFLDRCLAHTDRLPFPGGTLPVRETVMSFTALGSRRTSSAKYFFRLYLGL
jgi:hypothetical protein